MEKIVWKSCIFLREHAADAIYIEKKKMLTEIELKSHQDSTVGYICRKKFPQKLAKYKNHRKVKDHCHFAGKIQRCSS